MDVARLATSDDEERLLVVYAIQRLLALAPDERTLLRECCALLARYRHYLLVWSGAVEDDGAVSVTARAGSASTFIDGVRARWDDTIEGQGNVGWVIRTGQARVTRVTDPLYGHWRTRAQSFGIGSVLTLPLSLDGKVVRVLAAYSDEPNGFEEKERRLLEGLADDIARTVQLLRMRATAASEVARSRGRLARLETVRRLFASAGGEIEARRAVLLSEGTRALDLDFGAIGVVDDNALVFDAHLVDETTSQTRASIPLESSIAGRVLHEGRTRSWHDFADDRTLDGSHALVQRGYRTAIATPFSVDDRRYVLLFAGRRPHAASFQEEDHVYVELLASLFVEFLRHSDQQEKIEILRTVDQLTGLPNRTSLEEQLAEMTAARDAAERPFAVLAIDIDRFRGINSALGFAVGDHILCEVARRLRSLLREGDVLARIGGDCFGIVAGTRTPDAAADLARRLCERLSEPTAVDGNEIHLSASVGIALYPTDAAEPTELISCVSEAIATVRAEGGGRYRFYSHEIGEQLEAKRRFHRDVMRARERNEFRLYYQPEVDLASGRVVGAEALLRWFPAEGAMRRAAEFIPLAEDTGLIASLDQWALREAVSQIRRWELSGRDVVLACNLSGRSMHEPALLDELRELVSRSGIDPAHLQIEVTETVAMRDVARTSELLQGLRALGISVALDDFGTGYSSLMHLKSLPIDVIKIDGSFVQALPHRREDVAIVRATIALGHSLGRRIVAECVEEEEQVRWLAAQGCDFAQGYWYGEAMPAEDFEAWMDAR